MDRLGAIASFVLITVLALLGLRGVHLLIGVVSPQSLPGPFELASLEEVASHAGFQPHIPFYRPMILGPAPVEIVATRRPVPTARVLWQGEARLELTEQIGRRPTVPEQARPLPRHEEVLYWADDGQLVALLPVAKRWLTIRTDLDLAELERIVETLLPYDRLI